MAATGMIEQVMTDMTVLKGYQSRPPPIRTPQSVYQYSAPLPGSFRMNVVAQHRKNRPELKALQRQCHFWRSEPSSFTVTWWQPQGPTHRAGVKWYGAALLRGSMRFTPTSKLTGQQTTGTWHDAAWCCGRCSLRLPGRWGGHSSTDWHSNKDAGPALQVGCVARQSAALNYLNDVGGSSTRCWAQPKAEAFSGQQRV